MVRGYMNRYRKYIMLSVEFLIAVSLILVIEMITSKIGLSLDLSPGGSYSLSQRSQEILNSLDGPLNIKIFIKKEGEQERIRTLLDLYRNQNPLVQYELINMDRNPGLARKHNVHSYYTTVLEYKERIEKTGYPYEQNLSSALARLVGKVGSSIYFAVQPGETDFNEERGQEHDFDFAKMRLVTEGYDVRSVALNDISRISGDPRILAIIGRQGDIDESAIDLVKKFIQTGGQVLFFLDPVPLPNVERLLEEYGIKLPRMVVVDQEGHPPEWDDWTVVVPYINKQHPIAMGMDLPAVFPLCRPVQLEAPGGKQAMDLIATGKTSWATSTLMGLEERPSFNPGTDKKGPITVGVTREIDLENGQTAKIVVYGNSSFFDNTYIKLLGNGRLFVNTIHWARKEEFFKRDDAVGYGKALSLSSKEFGELQIFCFLLPLVIISIGCVMAFMRRRS